MHARDINGDGITDAFYDSSLNISWLADANAAAGSGYDATYGYGYGYMNWGEAKHWAADLNLFGITGWRLPTMVDTGAPGCDWSDGGGTDCGYKVQTISADGHTVFSELAHLYYVSLGNLGYCVPGSTQSSCSASNGQTGWGLTNTGGFRNLQAWAYWSGLPYAPSPQDHAWVFNTGYGYQRYYRQPGGLFALAVRPGDVTAAANAAQGNRRMAGWPRARQCRRQRCDSLIRSPTQCSGRESFDLKVGHRREMLDVGSQQGGWKFNGSGAYQCVGQAHAVGQG